MSCLRE
jgi:hypothetical protein